MKLCYQCNQEKEEYQFSKDKSKKDGLRSQCKLCRRDYQRTHLLKSNPKAKKMDYDRTIKRFRRYNITFEQYRAMLAAQNNCCSICKDVLSHTHVDHCHATNKVRGILCQKCNQGLGMFRDNIDFMKSAIEYLIHSRK